MNLQRPVRWKWAFDLSINNRENGTITPVEVKKRTRGSRLTSEIAQYLPTINIVLVRLGRSKNEYLEIAENYSRGRHNELIGEKRSKEQRRAIKMFTDVVDERLQELLEAA